MTSLVGATPAPAWFRQNALVHGTSLGHYLIDNGRKRYYYEWPVIVKWSGHTQAQVEAAEFDVPDLQLMAIPDGRPLTLDDGPSSPIGILAEVARVPIMLPPAPLPVPVNSPLVVQPPFQVPTPIAGAVPVPLAPVPIGFPIFTTPHPTPVPMPGLPNTPLPPPVPATVEVVNPAVPEPGAAARPWPLAHLAVGVIVTVLLFSLLKGAD